MLNKFPPRRPHLDATLDSFLIQQLLDQEGIQVIGAYLDGTLRASVESIADTVHEAITKHLF